MRCTLVLVCWLHCSCLSLSASEVSLGSFLLADLRACLPVQIPPQISLERSQQRYNSRTTTWFALALVKYICSLLAGWCPLNNAKKSSRCPLQWGLSLAVSSFSITLFPISYSPPSLSWLTWFHFPCIKWPFSSSEQVIFSRLPLR